MQRSPSELTPGSETNALLPYVTDLEFEVDRLGVGLAVVKLLVEQSGGTLSVESLEGRGTSFLATLPRYDINDYLNPEL